MNRSLDDSQPCVKGIIPHLRYVLNAYDQADRHIREELQPEFERLGEDRLATWWHGCDFGVDAAREFLETDIEAGLA